MRKYMSKIRNSESGFTLIEMLIVVGIIVALAAAVVPEYLQLSAKSSEQADVQTAIDNMMGAQELTAVTANSTSLNSFSTNQFGTGGAALNPTHLSIATSTHFYCWGTDGQVDRQDNSATSC